MSKKKLKLFDLASVQKLSAEWPTPKGVCICGHTGDGAKSQHATVVAGGHGPCLLCDCRRFTWDKRTPAFQEALDALRTKERV